MNIVFVGLTITSSWGNCHATTYRSLSRALVARGHEVTFLERDLPWYADNRDLVGAPSARVGLYASVAELRARFARVVRDADVAIVGSHVPEGIAVGRWMLDVARGVTAFYDLDTPVTLAQLAAGACPYIAADQIPRYQLYLSFTGGPLLAHLERELGAQRARALYCSIDPELYATDELPRRWDLGYMGAYCADRQSAVDRFVIAAARHEPARQFAVVGPQYPRAIEWPPNVERVEHLAPREGRAFYNACAFALNVTRRAMVEHGYSPSVRLFEAAACGTPIISDTWPGLDELFEPGRDILVARDADDVRRYLADLTNAERRRIGERGRVRVLAAHTAAYRACELERHVGEAHSR